MKYKWRECLSIAKGSGTIFCCFHEESQSLFLVTTDAQQLVILQYVIAEAVWTDVVVAIDIGNEGRVTHMWTHGNDIVVGHWSTKNQQLESIILVVQAQDVVVEQPII